jgi:hypothetical protein
MTGPLGKGEKIVNVCVLCPHYCVCMSSDLVLMYVSDQR